MNSKKSNKKTKFIILIIATILVIAISVSAIFMPLIQIYGSSMEPALSKGSIAVSVKSNDISCGDIIAFNYNDKVLVKRVIAKSGSVVSIDDNGNITVDGEQLEEAYITEKALGSCDIEFPYTVPENRYFVVGDNRADSIDSRSSAVGCISDDQLVGRVIFVIYPFSAVGKAS